MQCEVTSIATFFGDGGWDGVAKSSLICLKTENLLLQVHSLQSVMDPCFVFRCQISMFLPGFYSTPQDIAFSTKHD